MIEKIVYRVAFFAVIWLIALCTFVAIQSEKNRQPFKPYEATVVVSNITGISQASSN